MKLNGELPLDVTANLGAGEANLELGKMNLSRVEMSIGAGKVTMDLRGEPKRDYTVQIRGGVGETVVHLPKDVGIAATATKGIGDISIEGLRAARWRVGQSRPRRRAGHGSPGREGRRWGRFG